MIKEIDILRLVLSRLLCNMTVDENKIISFTAVIVYRGRML
jgi:hypothetical protein